MYFFLCCIGFHKEDSRITLLQNFADAQEKEDAFDRISRFRSEGLVDPKCSNNGVMSTSRTRLLLKNEVSKDIPSIHKFESGFNYAFCYFSCDCWETLESWIISLINNWVLDIHSMHYLLVAHLINPREGSPITKPAWLKLLNFQPRGLNLGPQCISNIEAYHHGPWILGSMVSQKSKQPGGLTYHILFCIVINKQETWYIFIHIRGIQLSLYIVKYLNITDGSWTS